LFTRYAAGQILTNLPRYHAPVSYTIRVATEDEYRAAARLYVDTVHAINSRDYSPAQIEAWARSAADIEHWMRRRNGRTCFAAFDGDQLVGFAELEDIPAIDCFYCHHNYQGKGVGRALMTHLLAAARKRGDSCLDVTSCITALPFFKRHGFVVTRDYITQHNGQSFQVYDMQLDLQLDRHT
jgi:putative acetyltransferase